MMKEKKIIKRRKGMKSEEGWEAVQEKPLWEVRI